MRNLVTTYYGPGRKRPVTKTTRGSRREEILPNICRNLTRNAYGAVVAECHDEETGELLLVVTYWIGAKLAVVFEQDVTHPICITNIDPEKS